MAFENAILGNGHDFDPAAVTESLLRQAIPEIPANSPIDIRDVNTRILRKLGQPSPSSQAPEPAATKAPLDFSGEAAPPPTNEVDPSLDFSGQAVSPPPYDMPQPPPVTGVGGNAKAFLKGIPHGAIEGTGGILKGAGALYDNGVPAQGETPQFDPMGNATGMVNAPTEAIPAKPLADRKLVQSGQAVQDFAQTVAPMSPAEKDSIAGRVGTGLGNIAPYAAATVAGGPAIGIAAGFAGMAADTYGKVYEEAKQHGASDDVAQSAAGRSALVAGVLGSLPLGAGKYAQGLIGKVASSSAAFTTAGEAQEAILQQIAKDYDPKAGYTLDQKRIIAELILGAGMGGLHHAFEGGKGGEKPADQPADATQPAAEARQKSEGGLPPPEPDFTDVGGDAGEAAPGSSGWRKPPPGSSGARDSGPQPGPDTGGPGNGKARPEAEPGKPPPGTGEGKASEAGYTMDSATRAKMERVYRHFEGGKDPSKMTDGELFDAVNEHLRDTSSTGYTAKPETPEEATAREGAATERTEREALKRRGWTDAHIDNMTPEQRRKYFQDAMRGEQAPPPKDTAEEPTAAGTREAPIKPKSADDVLKAQPVEPKSPAQAEAENFKHAHLELEQFGLTGKNSISVETGVGQERHSNEVDAEGKPKWSVKMEHAAYGRIKGTKGADGQPLDVFVGPHPTSPHIFVLDQHHPGGKGFDEHKILAGFRTPIDALHAYANSYTDGGGDRIGHVTAMGPEEFKDWLKNGDHTKQLGPQKQAEPPRAAIAKPRAGSDQPLSLLQFIASKGGIAPHPELSALDVAGDHRVQIPGRKGFFGLVRPTGDSLDMIREAAEEAGYLKGESNKTSTIRDLLDAIDSELRGQRRHAEGEELTTSRRERKLAAERERHERERDEADYGDARATLIDSGYQGLPADLHEAAVRLMVHDGLDPDSAVERAALRLVAEDPDYQVTTDAITDTFGEGAHDAIRAKSASENGEPSAREREEEPGPREGEEASGDGERVPDSRKEISEATEAGDQRVIPGAEKIGDGELAQRKADERLKPAVAQKAADEGLFGDEKDQTDLLDFKPQTPAIRKQLFVDIQGRKFPLTSFEDASRAYSGAVDRTAATSSGRTGPQAPQPVITDEKGNVVGYVSYNGRVWEGTPQDWSSKTKLLYDPSNEVTIEHRQAIEDLLGPTADSIRQVDIARAAEKLAEHPDMPPAVAFSQAVAEGSVGPGLATQEQAEEIYGPEIKEILQPVSARAPEDGAPVEPEATADAAPAKAHRVAEGGGKGVERAAEGRVEASDQSGDQGNDATGEVADTGRPAGDQAADRDAAANRPAAGDADGAELSPEDWWNKGLTPFGRREALRDAGLHTTDTVRWHYLNAEQQAKLLAFRAKQEASDGVQAPVHGRDAGPESETVSEAEGQQRARPLRADENAGSLEDVSGDTGKRPAAADAADGTGSRGTDESGDVPVSGRHADEQAGRAEGAVQRNPASDVKGENYRIEPGALGEDRGPKLKATDNVQAIKLANRLIEQDRPATAAEQHQLARYVGWGGIKGAFPDADGNFGKGFEQIGADVKDILTPEEYDTARRSIQYAHYTAEDVINGMWNAAERLGFKGGKVFEPGMGVGHFAGLMPGDVAARSAYNGVEMDHVTARIAKLLYPKWGVRREDFTKMPLAENAFDLAIGNPPFADVTIKADPKYAKDNFLLHDYFFAKSLDGVRPGGLLMFVTSAGTMNKIDPSARQYLADRAELVGAIRLPSNAFKKNAGTEVTTDIVILRKRMPGEAAGDRTWTETETVTLPGKDGKPTKGQISRYFAEHPEMVLGEGDFADKLYEGRYSVKAPKGFDLQTELAKAIDRLPSNVMRDGETQQERAEADFDTTEKKDGSYYIGKNGELMQQRAGAGYPVERRGKGVEGGKTAAELERIRKLIPIRDALRETFAADLADDADAGKTARARLNKAYDAFVAEFGPINKAEIQRRRPNSIQEESARSEAREEARYAGGEFDEGSFDPTSMIEAGKSLSEIARARKAARENQGANYREGGFDPEAMEDVIIDKRPNIEPFADDQENYRLRAIEKYDEPTGKAHKTLIFSKNIITKDKPPEINSVNDAVLYTLNQKGTLDIDTVAAMAGKSRTETIEALGDSAFQVPGTKEAWEPRDKYLSGNVRKKLAIAKAEAERNPAFRRNVEALEAAQPAPLAPSQIGASLGMPWIPPDVIEQFGKEGLGLESLRASYSPALASWSVSGDTDSVAATSTWGTARRNATALMLDALNRQVPKIYDHPDRDTRVLNVVATQAAQEKMQAIRDKFNEWIFSDEKRADKLASFYNENYNNLVVQDVDGSYLTTPGISANWSWRPHQKRAIARVIQNGNTYIAHAVGAGKTSEMIGAGMEMRRLGLVKKPMYAVPNHMLAQFTKEFYEQYPTARIMVADERQFHTDRRKQFIANVATSDLDAVIITHSSFGMIPVSGEFHDQILQEEIDEYRRALADMPKGGDNRITRSRIEKQIERLEQRLSGRSNKKRDSVFTFDEMGVDFLFVDEAHMFRKLDFSTQMSNLKGITPQGSGASWDLYVKSRYLDSKNPGRSLVLASGTPITNTMAELYTVSRYLQRQELAERQLSQFDAWAGAFGENVTELEQDAAGGYKPVSRFAKFVNVAELSAMARQVMDVVTSRQLSQYVVRPKLKGGKRIMNLAEKGPELEAYQASLAARMKAMEGRGKPQPGDDIMLKVIGDGRHAAIDMRLVGGDKSAEPSKLDLMVDNVFDIWKRTKRQKFYKPKDGSYDMSKPFDVGPATQMIFANLGISGARGFSVNDYIKSELIRRGIPRNEIAFIADFKNHVAKQKLFNDMNEGKVRILVGSTAKMATGVNAQKRLYAIHNHDPLWYPSDDEQRNGRGIRQGNMNPEIEIHDYSTKGTYDSTMWGMMEKKARFIQGFFEGDPSLRSMDDLGEAGQYEQAKALTTNDPRLMRLTELRQDYEKANRRKAAFENERYAIRQRRAQAKSDIEYYSAREINVEKDIAQRQPLAGDNFKAKIGRSEFTKRVDFGDALLKKLDDISTPANAGKDMPVGEISGFSLVARPRKLVDEVQVSLDLKRNGGAESHITVGTSGLGAVRSMESTIMGFDSDLAHIREKIKTAKKYMAESESQQSGKFSGDDDIARLGNEIRDLQAELSKKDEPPVVPPVEPEGTALADMSSRAVEKQPDIENLVRAIVRHMIGDHVKLELTDGLMPLPADASAAWGDMPNKGARGLYFPWKHLIRLAMIHGVDSSAFHESYHAIEYQLQTPQERELMARETPRLRDYVAKSRPHYSKEQIRNLAPEEVRAIAFEDYATARSKNEPDPGKGMHTGIRRWFQRLWDALRKLINDLRGLGFKSYEDIFEKAYRGDYAKASGETPRTEANGPALASIHTAGEGSHGNTFKKDGSFDSSIEDVLGRRLLGRLSDLNLTEARTQLQDKFARVKNAEDSVGAPSSLSAYQAESLYYGRTGHRLEQLIEHHIDPLIREMKARDIDVNSLDKFLYARHAPERNNNLGASYPAGHDFNDAMRDQSKVGASGMSTGEALKIIRAVKAEGKLSDYLAVAKMVDAINAKTRRTLFDAGLISRDTYDNLNATYKYYVPLRGWAEGSEHAESIARGSGMGIKGKEFKQAFGRQSEAASPLAYSIMQAELAIVRAEKNKVGNTFLKFVRANPDPSRWTIDKGESVKRIDPETGLVTEIPNNLSLQADNVFSTKVDGKTVNITLKGPDGLNLARALKNMGTANVHALIRAYSTLTHTMAKLATSFNPDFMIPNFARDMGEAFINLQAQEQKGFVRNFLKHVPGAMRGAMIALSGKTPEPGTKMARYVDAFHRFDEAGGRIRFFGIDDPDQIERNAVRKLKRLNSTPLNTLKDIGDKAGKALEIAGGGIENATRLAAFMAAEDAGIPTADAAMMARNLTVDFNKKGELGGVISSLYMFANAGIQGQARMIKALGNRRVWKAVGGMAAAAALATLYSILTGGEDEAGVPNYMKIPAWERDKNLIFMTSGGYYVKVPLPYGFAPFAVTGARSMAVMLGHEKPGKAASAIIDSIISAFNPLGEESSMWMDVVPSAIRPAFHVIFNKNWTGKPLYPDQDRARGQKPDSTQSFKNDSAFSKEAAKQLNTWSGGSAYQAGAIDVHPGSIDHVLQAIGGGVGRFAKSIADTAYNAINGDEWQPEKTPILRRFIGKVGEEADRAAYYEKRQEVRDREANVAQAKKDRAAGVNVDEAKEFIDQAGKEVRQKYIFENAEKQMKPLRKQEADINNSAVPYETKQQELAKVRQRMRDIQNSARAASSRLNAPAP